MGLFCKRALQKSQYSAKETYNFIDPTNRSHPITRILPVHIYIKRILPATHACVRVRSSMPYLFVHHCCMYDIFTHMCALECIYYWNRILPETHVCVRVNTCLPNNYLFITVVFMTYSRVIRSTYMIGIKSSQQHTCVCARNYMSTVSICSSLLYV